MKKVLYFILTTSTLFSALSCEKLVAVDSPVTSSNSSTVYSSDATATSVVIGIYDQLSTGSFLSGRYSLSLYAGLSADEFNIFNNIADVSVSQYYRNDISPVNSNGVSFWAEIYPYIYKANDLLSNLQNAVGISDAVKSQLSGEAHFFRALCYFYLVNLYGDVPITETTAYQSNSRLSRSPAADVYKFIINDLKLAQEQLNVDYVAGNSITSTDERIRVNKAAATALLARVYLFTKDYASAEQASNSVINNTELYDTVPLSNVFLKNNKEAIWQLQPVDAGVNTSDATLFVIQPSGPNNTSNFVWLNNALLNSFEPGDKRRSEWIGSVTVSSGTYLFPYKYKINTYGAPVTEYQTVLRLGEQYLIRSEARIQQGKTAEGIEDLNIIRRRAGLSDYEGSMDKSALLTAILHERQVELFSEYGSRWLDLKRTDKVDEVMSVITPLKGGTWKKEYALYPIAQYELSLNQNLQQNAGY